MSFLAPLYVLGGLAIALPILFHLIRCRPKDDQLFSSLLFLKPTPPRLTKRSRLDQWPLLLLRILAVLGLAFAFARPFVRDSELAIETQPGKHLAILLDTSASMSRQGVWDQAIAAAQSVLQTVAPEDQVTLITFDRQPSVVAANYDPDRSADDTSGNTLTSTDMARILEGLQPTLAAGDLGQAVVFAADLLAKGNGSEQEDADDRTIKQLAVISDFQRGSQEPMQALQSYAWPKNVSVKLHSIVAQDPSNAFAELLAATQSSAVDVSADKAPGSESLPVRVRVTNSRESKQQEFKIGWGTAAGELSAANSVPVQVPPGTSRIVALPYPPGEKNSFASLVLSGDGQTFDNTRFVATPAPRSFKLLFVSDSKAKPDQSAGYFLGKVPLDDPRRMVELVSVTSDKLASPLDREQIPLIVAQNELSPDAFTALRQYVETGGQLLWMMDSEGKPDALLRGLQPLFQHDALQIRLSSEQDYTMWTKIDFEHSLFAPFADPRFNDFTKIRFWKHWQVSDLPKQCQVLAEYEDHSPALIESTVGSGKVWLLTAGWQPLESQLSLSTKFVPIISKLFTSSIAWSDAPSSFTVGKVPEDLPLAGQRVLDEQRKELVTLQSSSDWAALAQPGFYYLADDRGELAMAMNIASSESLTETIGEDEWERLGVQLKPLQDVEDDVAVKRQKRDVELEQNQSFWQWFVLTVIALLTVEGLVRGMVDRRASVAEG